MAKLKLCYVEDLGLGMYYVLFFSKKNTKDVWGDDWDDVPYEHNASEPYEYDKKIIVEQGNTIITPCSEYNNSPYSVEDINNKAVPWIYFKYDDKIGKTLCSGHPSAVLCYRYITTSFRNRFKGGSPKICEGSVLSVTMSERQLKMILDKLDMIRLELLRLRALLLPEEELSEDEKRRLEEARASARIDG